MFNMRLKLGSAGKNEWRACFCLHVKTATIVFGVYHLLLHVLALTVVSLVMRNQSYINQKNEFNKKDYLEGDFLPTPLSKVKNDDNPYFLPTTQDGRTVLPSDVDMGAIITICTLSITLLMVYGAIKGKPKHILPFFFLQLFDFAITTLTATGYFCYLRSVHRLVAENWHNMPFHQELLSLSPQTLSLLVLLSFLVSMIWKAYWIGVVWRCYKYLTLKKQATHNTIHYILPNDGLDRSEPDYAAMFRDNEAALFGPMKQTAPPSYQDVMDDQPPPYPAVTAEESPITTTTTCVVQEVPIRRFLVTYSPDNPQEVQPEDSASSSEETVAARDLASTASPTASAFNVASPNNEHDNKEEEHVLQVDEDPEYCYLDAEALKRDANEEKPEK